MTANTEKLEKSGRPYAVTAMLIAILVGGLGNLWVSLSQRAANIDALTIKPTNEERLCSIIDLSPLWDPKFGCGETYSNRSVVNREEVNNRLNEKLHDGVGLPALVGRILFPEREFLVTRMINAATPDDFTREPMTTDEQKGGAALDNSALDETTAPETTEAPAPTEAAQPTEDGEGTPYQRPEVPFYALFFGLEQMLCYGIFSFALVQLYFFERRVRIEVTFLESVKSQVFLLSHNEGHYKHKIEQAFQSNPLGDVNGIGSEMQKDFLEQGLEGLGKHAETHDNRSLALKTVWGRAFLSICDAIRSGGRSESSENAVDRAMTASKERIASTTDYVGAIQWAIPSIGFAGSIRGMIGAFQSASGPEALSTVTNQLGVAFYSTYVSIGLGLILVLFRTIVNSRYQRLFLDAEDKIENTMIRHLPN